MKPQDFVRILTAFFVRVHKKLVFHNGNFDRHFLEEMGIFLGDYDLDTIIGYHLTNDQERLSLKDIANREFNAGVEKFKKFFNKKNPIEDSEPAIYEQYLFNDVFYTHKLARLIKRRLTEQKMETYLKKIEMPTYRVCYEMERLGAYIDVPKLKEIGEDVEQRIVEAKGHIFELVGDPDFNPNSTKQMAAVVFDKLNAPVIKTSKKTGKPSCDAATLEIYSKSRKASQELRDFASAILTYREFSKIHSTYVKGIMDRLGPDGRIHTQFKQLTGTGRLSSADPNVQNIPSDSKAYGYIMRSCFIAPPNWRLIVFDYSQIELRIVAHTSQDPELLHAYNNGIDI
nr:DNA polymerase [Candidatus Sigynarchaeota archaeon]